MRFSGCPSTVNKLVEFDVWSVPVWWSLKLCLFRSISYIIRKVRGFCVLCELYSFNLNTQRINNILQHFCWWHIRRSIYWVYIVWRIFKITRHTIMEFIKSNKKFFRYKQLNNDFDDESRWEAMKCRFVLITVNEIYLLFDRNKARNCDKAHRTVPSTLYWLILRTV